MVEVSAVFPAVSRRKRPRRPASDRWFRAINLAVLVMIATLCVIPFINLLAVSLSSSPAVTAGKVSLWPIGFTVESYTFAMKSGAFTRAFLVSILRVVVGVSVNMVLTILVAYPLSKTKSGFRYRSWYAWFFMVTTLVNGGLIPLYMTIRFLGLLDSMGALVLPTALPVFNVIVLLNFFRTIPKELEESAYMDGAGEWTILWRIFVRLSKPALATLTLYALVFHWNSWFDGLIYMNDPAKYPLQSYLQTVILTPEAFFRAMSVSSDYQAFLGMVSARTAKSAQIFIAAFPMLVVYPFLQKYFTKGLILGSIKG